MSTFLTAAQARSGARNDLLLHNEISDIETAIIMAVDMHQMDVDVGTTYMTGNMSGIPYWEVWQNLAVDRSLSDQMNIVIKYFTDLGYSITRKTNSSTGNTFVWSILW